MNYLQMHGKFFIYALLACSIGLHLTSCSGRSDYRIRALAETPVEVVRFDSLLVEYGSLADTSAFRDAVAAHGAFWDIYNRHVLGLADAPYYREGLAAFLGDTSVARLYADTQRTYADFTGEARALSALAARYGTLFPELPMPVFQTHVSGLNQSIVTMDSLLSVSLDCYLGSDYPLYAHRYHDYELRAHGRERLIADVGEVLLRNALPLPEGETLIDAMVYEGRILYLLSGLLGTDSVETTMGYSADEAQWCEENEAAIWHSIVEQQHLFASDNILVRKYIHPAPFTAPLTREAPSRAGRWTGWRIVAEYARREGLSPQDVARDTLPAIDVLRLSKYDGK